MKLLPFQEKGVEYLRADRQRLLADDPGLGKTVQALMAIPDPAPPVIVVCPSALRDNWKREAAKWRPDLMVLTVTHRRDWGLPGPGEMMIVAWDILPDNTQGLEPSTIVIADEVHAAKNPLAIRTKNFRALRKEAIRVGGACWGMTGTPLYNDPLDLWNVLVSLGMEKDVFGRFGTFEYMFRSYKTPFGMRWGTPRPEVPALLAKQILGRKRTDVLPDLPQKFYSNIHVEVPVGDIGEVHVNEHGHSSDISTVRERLARHKARAALPALKEMASREPLVVFSAYRGGVEEVAAALDVPMGVGGGGVSDVVDAFVAGRIPHFVGTIAAAGVGFTLVRSSAVVFIDRDWTPALNEQAEDRVCRIGQTRGVRIYDVVSDHPLDTRVERILDAKYKIEHLSIGEMKGRS